MSWRERMDIKDIINILMLFVTFGSMVTTWRSLGITREQFKLTNQGYLDIEPQMPLNNKDVDKKLTISNLSDDFPFHSFSPYVVLKNVGNIPLTYTIKKYDFYINRKKVTEDFKDVDNLTGVLYPGRQINFNRTAVYFDGKKHEPITFGDIKKLDIINEIKIEYSSSNAPKEYRYIDRKLNWTFHDNTVDISYQKINDECF